MPTQTLSEAELREIVTRVVRRTLGAGGAAGAGALAPTTPPAATRPETGVVAFGADHGGFGLKQALKEFVAGLGYAVVDCGTHSTDPVDYPDLAYAVARLVSAGEAWRGIVVDGAGIGSAMAANKVPGVRAALCYDHASAVNSREHNDANVLTLGAGLIGPNLARQITQTWLSTPYAGGRHQRRIDKILEIEKRFLRNGA
jgi:ribose 5-phosphate isomerase B